MDSLSLFFFRISICYENRARKVWKDKNWISYDANAPRPKIIQITESGNYRTLSHLVDTWAFYIHILEPSIKSLISENQGYISHSFFAPSKIIFLYSCTILFATLCYLNSRWLRHFGDNIKQKREKGYFFLWGIAKILNELVVQSFVIALYRKCHNNIWNFYGVLVPLLPW